MNDPDPSPPPAASGRLARASRPAALTGWRRWLPGLRMLREYDATWLRHDIVAGLVLTTMLGPARLRGVRPQPHPGAGARFGARRGDPRRRRAAVGRQSDARGRAGRGDGG